MTKIVAAFASDNNKVRVIMKGLAKSYCVLLHLLVKRAMRHSMREALAYIGSRGQPSPVIAKLAVAADTHFADDEHWHAHLVGIGIQTPVDATLPMVLDRPEIPLHTNGSENDIRC